MDILKRELAPIAAEAWAEIDAQATRGLKALLSGRKVIPVSGPMGPNFPGVPEGRLDFPKDQAEGITFGIHRVHHLVEVRVPFAVDVQEMDNVVRGARDIDLRDLEQAAQKIALFEERVIYHGLPEANIRGLKACTGGECLTIGTAAEQLLEAVAEGVTRCRRFGGRALQLRGRAAPVEPDVRASAGLPGQDAGREHPGRPSGPEFLPDRRVGRGGLHDLAARRGPGTHPGPGPRDRLRVPRRPQGPAVLHRVVHDAGHRAESRATLHRHVIRERVQGFRNQRSEVR